MARHIRRHCLNPALRRPFALGTTFYKRTYRRGSLCSRQFTLADEFLLEQVRTQAAADATLQAAAPPNALENFRLIFDPTVQGIFIDRMEQNQDLFAKLMTDTDLAALVTRSLRQDVYERILETEEANGGPRPSS